MHGLSRYLFDCFYNEIYYWCRYSLTTLNKAKSGQVSTNNGIITQNICNASVLAPVELKKLYKQAIIL